MYGSIATIILAVVFTAFQGVEYVVSSFTISDGVFGTVFFFGTGFHGFNINPYLLGSAAFSYLTLVRVKRRKLFINKNKNNYHSSIYKLHRNFYNKRQYSTTSTNLKESELSPYWVTGFSDAESSFIIKVFEKSSSKSRWHVIPEFRIELHSKDTLLLKKIQSYFGIGIISERANLNIVIFSVQSRIDITNVIIPHFDKHPLITQKKADYLLFKQAINLLNSKIQSDIKGIHSIVSIKASLNWGLSDTFKIKFPTVLPVARPVVSFEGIPHPDWLAGFVDGEGCFYVNTKKAKSYLTGYQVIMSFSLSQHVRDELLLTKFIDYLGCGKIERASTRPNHVTFVVYRFSDIFGKIIPFFQSYPLQGLKYLDYKDFCEIAKIMENKKHLTLEGLKKIKSLKSGMNIGRICD